MSQSFYQFFTHRPEFVLIFSFLVLILLGTVLLKLPLAVPDGKPLSFVDALFTATSASTVTGLTVKDTSKDFTRPGQFIILTLIQLGALGIMTVAGFSFLIVRKTASLSQKVGLKEMLGVDYISEVVKLIRFIILSIFIFEFFGGILLFIWWGIDGGFSLSTLFSSFFHSISAFCNAGFSLFSNSLQNFRGDIFVNLVISFLIIFGGLGFLVLEDLKKFFLNRNSRQKRISLHTKIVLISSFVLIIFGAATFFLLENENLSFLSLKEKLLVSYFQSITARTAGFNTIDIGILEKPTHLLLLFLMFIGGSPGSAAGGIKVVCLFLIMAFIFSRLSGKDRLIIFRMEISKESLNQALIIAIVSALILLVFSTLLLYTENDLFEFEEVIFETFSAFGTVGLSTGITPELSGTGKILVSVLMFFGRVTPLALAIILSRGISRPKIIFPEEKVSLG